MTRQEFAGYSIVRHLANGGMTNLMVGRDEDGDRVVIRKLRPEMNRDRKIRAAFFKGAEILAKLSHPNVVRLVKAGYFHDEAFMALEYVESRNMRDLIRQKDPLLYENILPMFRQIAHALNYVHLSGYLHLDIKPDNLLVRSDGLVILIDFDLTIERPVKLHSVPGTAAYLPPETLEKALVDEQTDIFSFGVTCYEILSGHKPFEGVTPEDTRRLQLDRSVHPRRLSLHNVKVSPALERIISRCLAKDRDDRYPSMALVTRDIETLI